MSYDFCSEDFSPECYWWGQTQNGRDQGQTDLPSSVDVLIIGSGYTGLHCALQTAAAGRDTLVIDAEAPGWGCSTRNGGQISGEIKPGFIELQHRFGSDRARALILEARAALQWIGDYVDEHQIDCEYRRCGRFVAAHNPRQFEALVSQAEHQVEGLERPVEIISPEEQSSEIDSDYYHGGIVIDSHCSLDPRKYHQGLLDRAREQGASVVGNCRAEQVARDGDGFIVTTSRGRIRCRDLVIATNGYTDSVASWQQRRIIPIGSYMLATEAMDAERAQALMPRDRVFSDTRKVVVYFRKSPDGRRLLFGGRVSVFESDPVKSLPLLRDEMLRIFPQLDDVKISNTWMGFVGYTFDNLPHLGQQDGIYYAMGYCGSGICLASYFGHKLGLKLLGRPEGESAFDSPGFETRPLYHGKPWFLAAAVRYYQFMDRIG